jgi:hypothetical protein
MKSKDQQLLEEAYNQILNEKQLRLIEEGKITDFLKKLGKGATNTFLKAKNALTTNPSLMKKFTIASSILLALAAGNTAQAATYGADAVNDLISQITNASTDGSLDTAELQKIMSGWEQSHQNLASGTDIAPDANQVIDSSMNKANKMLGTASDLNMNNLEDVAKGIGDVAGADKIENIVGNYDMQIKADYLKNKPSLDSVAKDIASEARYRGFSLDQVKQILSGMDKKNISPQTQANLQKLISLIKF